MFTEGLDIGVNALEMGRAYSRIPSPCYSVGFALTPNIELSLAYAAKPQAVYTPSMAVAADVRLGSSYHFFPAHQYVAGTEIWHYADQAETRSLDVAAVDPITGPYTKHFTPGFLLTVGKLLDFTWNPRYGRAPLRVQFTSLCSPMVTQWFWQFGDGFNSIDQNPVHIYKRPGVYDVSLQVRIAMRWYEVKKRLGGYE